MSIISRPAYLEKLIAKQHNGKVKIITGIRRSGKSFLLDTLYRNHLLSQGISNEQIISISLDRAEFYTLRNPHELRSYILQRITPTMSYFVFIDEIQLSYKVKRDDIDANAIAPEDSDLLYTTFYDVLNELIAIPQLDVYVTGSNSRMLSFDIVSSFRDRGSEIRMSPLSFAEYFDFCGLEKQEAWQNYVVYGGMPLAVLEPDILERESYLKSLFNMVYQADIIERYGFENATSLDSIAKELASAVGSLTNPAKLARTLDSVAHVKVTDKTIKKYLSALEDAYIFSRAERFDIKGKRYLSSPSKYYAEDTGLSNALLNFRQIEETHLMENILYCELRRRGYSVDVGAVRVAETKNGARSDSMREIDFVVNLGHQKAYIQSALSVAEEEKKHQEITPLLKSGDFFRKFVVVGGTQQAQTDENGIIYVGVIPFLLDPKILATA